MENDINCPICKKLLLGAKCNGQFLVANNKGYCNCDNNKPSDAELEAFAEATRVRPPIIPSIFTKHDVECLMREAGFEHFKVAASRREPGLVYILIGHDDYIINEVAAELEIMNSIGTVKKIVDCNGYSQEIF